MAINDSLSKMLVSVGLKKSDIRRTKEEIERREMRVKELFDKMAGHIEQLRITEARLRELRGQYEKSSNAVKNAYALQIRSVMKELNDSQESRELIAREIDKENTVLHNLRIILEKQENPVDPDAITDITEGKEEMLQEFEREDREMAELNRTTYAAETGDEQETRTGSEIDYDALEKELGAMLDNPDAPSADKENNDSGNPREDA